MEEKMDEMKPIIRSILLALGRRATEREFRSEYFNTEGDSINTILQNLQMSFTNFLKTMPDVCRVFEMNGVVHIERVSTNESAHMDHLTAAIKKKRKSDMPPRFRHLGSSFSNLTVSRLPPRPLHVWTANANRVPSSTANRCPPSATNHGRAKVGTTHQPRNRALRPINEITWRGPPSIPARPISAPPIQKNRYPARTIPKSSVLPPHMTMPKTVYKGKSDDDETPQESPRETAAVNGLHSLPTSNQGSDGNESSSDSSSMYSDDSQENSRFNKTIPIGTSSPVESQQNAIPSIISHFDKLRLEAKYGTARKQEPEPVPALQSNNPFAAELAQQHVQRQLQQQVQQHAEQHVQQQIQQHAHQQVQQQIQQHAEQHVKQQIQHLDSHDEHHAPVTTWKNSSSDGDKENIADSTNAPGDSKKKSCRILNVALSDIIKQTENDGMKKKTQDADRNLNSDRQHKKVFDFLTQYVTRSSVSIPYPTLKESTSKRFFDVKLVEFVSPSLFTFQFDLSGYKSLTEEMNSHYNNLDASKTAELRVERAFQGLAVAAHDEGNWHRVEIINVDDCEAYVLFVDRGCKKRVNLHTLRYLEKSFTTQSRKSAKGSLFGVKPKDGEKIWRIAATMTLMAKTKDLELLATIKGRMDDIYELSVIIDIKQRTRLSDFMLVEGLCDAMDNVDFTMNQILV